MEEENLYIEIAEKMAGAEQSKMFGKRCLKVNGKAFTCFFENEMVFKLNGEIHKKALSLKARSYLIPPEKKGQ